MKDLKVHQENHNPHASVLSPACVCFNLTDIRIGPSESLLKLNHLHLKGVEPSGAYYLSPFVACSILYGIKNRRCAYNLHYIFANNIS